MLMNMRDLLAVAHANHFAVPAFNISSNMLLSGIMEASEEKQAPVILAIHPDELAFVRPSFVRSAVEEAHRATVPVCIHLDHGSSLAQVMQAIQCGFTSVMIDASTRPLEENIRICKEIVALAHAVDVSVEGELGTIGTTGPEAEAGTDVIIYTDPDDVVTFVDATGVDSLAVAIGTSHGIYPKDKKPELKLDLLKEIASRVDIPLVLHGGSANPDEEIAAAEAGRQQDQHLQRRQGRLLPEAPRGAEGRSGDPRAKRYLSALYQSHERSCLPQDRPRCDRSGALSALPGLAAG